MSDRSWETVAVDNIGPEHIGKVVHCESTVERKMMQGATIVDAGNQTDTILGVMLGVYTDPNGTKSIVFQHGMMTHVNHVEVWLGDTAGWYDDVDND